MVLVKKANGKWRMYVDHMDLNNASPRDSYPLPHIDQQVDATAANTKLSFMNALDATKS